MQPYTIDVDSYGRIIMSDPLILSKIENSVLEMELAKSDNNCSGCGAGC